MKTIYNKHTYSKSYSDFNVKVTSSNEKIKSGHVKNQSIGLVPIIAPKGVLEITIEDLITDRSSKTAKKHEIVKAFEKYD